MELINWLYIRLFIRLQRAAAGFGSWDQQPGI